MSFDDLLEAVSRIESAAWAAANNQWKDLSDEELQNMGAIYELSIYSPNWLIEESWSFPPLSDFGDYPMSAFYLLENNLGLIAWHTQHAYKVELYNSFYGHGVASFSQGV